MPSSYNLANKTINDYLMSGICYIGLFINEVQRDATGTEVNAPSYSRKIITFNLPNGGITTNMTDIFFDQAQEDWGIVSYYGVFNAAVNGDLLFYDTLLFNETVKSGETLRIPTGQLQLSVI